MTSEEPFSENTNTQPGSEESFSKLVSDPVGTDPEETGTQSELKDNELNPRRWKSILLGLLIVILVSLCGFLFYYFNQPAPLPELLPVPIDLSFPPHYLFSIYEVDRPVGVAVSPDGERLYVAETG